MTNEEQIYRNGQRDAYRNMSYVLNHAIKKNGGATTALQVVNVFNEILASIQVNLIQLERTKQDVESVDKKDNIDIIRELNNGLEDFFEKIIIFSTKGED